MLVALAPLIYLASMAVLDTELAKQQAVQQYHAARLAQRLVLASVLVPVL